MYCGIAKDGIGAEYICAWSSIEFVQKRNNLQLKGSLESKMLVMNARSAITVLYTVASKDVWYLCYA